MVADCPWWQVVTRGRLSPERIVSGGLTWWQQSTGGRLSPGAGCHRGGLSQGGLSWGGLSPGGLSLGAMSLQRFFN